MTIFIAIPASDGGDSFGEWCWEKLGMGGENKGRKREGESNALQVFFPSNYLLEF